MTKTNHAGYDKVYTKTRIDIPSTHNFSTLVSIVADFKKTEEVKRAMNPMNKTIAACF